MGNPLSEKSSEIKKAAGFFIAPFINLLIGFISAPITTRLLIPEQFGIAAFYTTVSEILFLFISFSSPAAFERFYVEIYDTRKLLRHVLFCPFVIFITTALIISFFIERLSLLIFGQLNIKLILLLLFTTGLRVFTEISTTVIRMDNQPALHSATIIFRRFTMLCATVSLLYFYKRNYFSIIIGSALTEVLHAVFLCFLTKKYLKFFEKLDYHLINKLFRYSLPLVPATMLTWIYSATDKAVLRSLGNYNDIGLYSGAFKIVTIINILCLGVTHYWRPASLHWYHDNKERIKVRKIGEAIIFLAALSAILLVMSKDFIIQLLGNEYASSASFLPFLILTPIFGIFGLLSQVGLIYQKNTKVILYISVIAALFNLVLSVTLVKRYGIIGCSIATGLSSLLQFILAGIICRIISYNYVSFRIIYAAVLLVITVFLTLFPGKIYILAGALSLLLLFIANSANCRLIALETASLVRKLF